jgi:hypothetical protein
MFSTLLGILSTWSGGVEGALCLVDKYPCQAPFLSPLSPKLSRVPRIREANPAPLWVQRSLVDQWPIPVLSSFRLPRRRESRRLAALLVAAPAAPRAAAPPATRSGGRAAASAAFPPQPRARRSRAPASAAHPPQPRSRLRPASTSAARQPLKLPLPLVLYNPASFM